MQQRVAVGRGVAALSMASRRRLQASSVRVAERGGGENGGLGRGEDDKT